MSLSEETPRERYNRYQKQLDAYQEELEKKLSELMGEEIKLVKPSPKSARAKEEN